MAETSVSRLFLTYFLINILTQIIRTIYVGLTGNEDAITHAQNYIPTATYGFIMVLNLVLSVVFFLLVWVYYEEEGKSGVRADLQDI